MRKKITGMEFRLLIKKAGLTNAQAADLTGINKKTLRRWQVEKMQYIPVSVIQLLQLYGERN